MYKIVFTLFIVFHFFCTLAQQGNDILGNVMQRGAGLGGNGGGKKDSIAFEHRNDAKDSINISFKHVDSIRMLKYDNSFSDFYNYFSIPAGQQYLGNNGSAGYSLIFSPLTKAGWDAGFHSFDIYKFTLDDTKFYKVTKPFSQINYQLASGKEQFIKVLHTQNPKPNLNFGFEYRLVNAPGFLKVQNTNHNSYRFFSNYQGLKKRYAAYFLLQGNAINASENGGLANDSNLKDPQYSRRISLPINLGGAPKSDPNPFETTINTGNKYKDFTFFFRHSYDVGKKDSIIINDSTTEYLFYSKFRFQHTFTYNTQSYQFGDNAADSTLYKNWYDTTLPKAKNNVLFLDKWKFVSNDFSILQFPNTKNLGQYIMAGIRLENIKGTFNNSNSSFYNLVLHGEYRNKTKNKKWDILAKGEFYLNGFNSGDYSIYGTLTRLLGSKLGAIQLLFQNTNRSPSYIFNNASSFSFNNNSLSKKENITIVKASADNKFFTLSATNYLIANYAFFSDYAKTSQSATIINLLQISASKKIKLSKKWNLYTEAVLQQTDGAAPIKVPLFYTRNRLAYEGVFFKNLNLSTGIEFRYYTPYKAYNYSPITGQFMPQDSVQINNRPDITAFVHFKIKSFTAFIRAENLNAMNFSNGFGFTNNNFAAPHYIYPGFIFRFGIRWNFVN